MYKIHQSKVDLASTTICYTEIVPLRTTFCVDVILHVELVGWEGLLWVVEGHEEISAFEVTAEGEPMGSRSCRTNLHYFC